MLRRRGGAGRRRGSRRVCVVSAVRRIIATVIGILVVVVVRAIIGIVRILRLLGLAVAAFASAVVAKLWWRIATHRRGGYLHSAMIAHLRR